MGTGEEDVEDVGGYEAGSSWLDCQMDLWRGGEGYSPVRRMRDMVMIVEIAGLFVCAVSS